MIKPGQYGVSFNITFPGYVQVQAESAEAAMDMVENFLDHQLDLDWQASLRSAIVTPDWAELVQADPVTPDEDDEADDEAEDDEADDEAEDD